MYFAFFTNNILSYLLWSPVIAVHVNCRAHVALGTMASSWSWNQVHGETVYTIPGMTITRMRWILVQYWCLYNPDSYVPGQYIGKCSGHRHFSAHCHTCHTPYYHLCQAISPASYRVLALFSSSTEGPVRSINISTVFVVIAARGKLDGFHPVSRVLAARDMGYWSSQFKLKLNSFYRTNIMIYSWQGV